MPKATERNTARPPFRKAGPPVLMRKQLKHIAETAPPPRPAIRREAPMIDPALLEDQYGMVVVGACLNPEIKHGTTLLFDKTRTPCVGDFAIFWRRPELVRPGDLQAMVKRLVTAIPTGTRFPFNEHPDSTVRLLVIAEQLNPRRRYAIPCTDLLAIHYCAGPMPATAETYRAPVDDIVPR